MGDIEELIKTVDYKDVLFYFAEISRVPRGSGHNGKISTYLVEFAKSHGLRYVKDVFENVIIYKPASPGYEGHTGVVLQGHMDMVCVAGEGVSHSAGTMALRWHTVWHSWLMKRQSTRRSRWLLQRMKKQVCTVQKDWMPRLFQGGI